MILALPERPVPEEETFARQAERAGLVLPRTRPLDLRWASVVTVVVVAVSVGVGQWVGWAIGPTADRPAVGVYGPQDCVGAPSTVSAYLTGSVASVAGADWAGALKGLGGSFSNWSGGCVHLEVSVSATDGYRPDLSGRHVLFVASTSAPDSSDRSAFPQPVAVVPTALVSLEVVYNLPGLDTPLRLNGNVLAGVYLGEITSWNDPQIVALNPTANLSQAPAIVPVHRDDTSSENRALTTFLADSNATWAVAPGAGASVAWPTGVEVNDSSEMASAVTSTPGAIGYLDSAVPLPSAARYATLQSSDGSFVLPSPANATSAAAALASEPAIADHDWPNVTIVNAPGENSYPLVEPVYATIYQDPGTAYGTTLSLTNATWLLSFLWWTVTNASAIVPTIGLGALPVALVAVAQQSLENVTYDGGPILESGEDGGGETGEF